LGEKRLKMEKTTFIISLNDSKNMLPFGEKNESGKKVITTGDNMFLITPNNNLKHVNAEFMLGKYKITLSTNQIEGTNFEKNFENFVKELYQNIKA
jgi:hypothetical protein